MATFRIATIVVLKAADAVTALALLPQPAGATLEHVVIDELAPAPPPPAENPYPADSSLFYAWAAGNEAAAEWTARHIGD